MTSSKQKDAHSRRDFLKAGAAGLGIATLSPLARLLDRDLEALPLGTKRLIIVFLEGGNDGLNTFVPVKQSAYFDRRPSLHIPANRALSMNTGPHATTSYRMHPACKELAGLWAEGSLAVVQKVGYPSPNLSHFFSLDIWSRGARSTAALADGDSGWIARFKDRYAPEPVEVFGIGTRNQLDFSGGRTQSVLVKSLERFKTSEDTKYRTNTRFRHELVQHVLTAYAGELSNLRAREATSLGYAMVQKIQQALASYSSPIQYPQTTFASRCRDAAILTKAGFKTRLVYLKDGGFDTHAKQGGVTGRHAELLTRIDGGLGALARDLRDMGAWNDTVVAVVSEFGRRNYENGSAGTDHGTANALFAFGGRVRGGFHGPELTEADLLARFPPYEIDFRSFYSELLERHLGVDPRPVFPEAQEKNGRPRLL